MRLRCRVPVSSWYSFSCSPGRIWNPQGTNQLSYYASRHSDAEFLLAQIRAAVNTLRSLVAKEGRDPFSLKVILGATIILGETDEEAQAKEIDLRSTASTLGAEVLIGGWVGHFLVQSANPSR